MKQMLTFKMKQESTCWTFGPLMYIILVWKKHHAGQVDNSSFHSQNGEAQSLLC